MTETPLTGSVKPEIALTAVGAALVAVLIGIGFASGEMIRHLVQATPVLLATLVAWRRPDWGRWALAPAFLFWLAISIGIWFFLLGLPSPLSGTFNPAEQTLAGTLGVVSLAGLALFPRIQRRAPWTIGVLVFAAFAALQYLGFLLSVQPAIAHR